MRKIAIDPHAEPGTAFAGVPAVGTGAVVGNCQVVAVVSDVVKCKILDRLIGKRLQHKKSSECRPESDEPLNAMTSSEERTSAEAGAEGSRMPHREARGSVCVQWFWFLF